MGGYSSRWPITSVVRMVAPLWIAFQWVVHSSSITLRRMTIPFSKVCSTSPVILLSNHTLALSPSSVTTPKRIKRTTRCGRHFTVAALRRTLGRLAQPMRLRARVTHGHATPSSRFTVRPIINVGRALRRIRARPLRMTRAGLGPSRSTGIGRITLRANAVTYCFPSSSERLTAAMHRARGQRRSSVGAPISRGGTRSMLGVTTMRGGVCPSPFGTLKWRLMEVPNAICGLRWVI